MKQYKCDICRWVGTEPTAGDREHWYHLSHLERDVPEGYPPDDIHWHVCSMACLRRLVLGMSGR